MNRREFGGHLVKGAAVVGVITMTGAPALFISGCNIFTDIKNWVPVGKATVDSIISVLSANGVALPAPALAVVTLIEAGFTDLAGAITEYQSTTPAPVGTLAKIETAFKDIVDNFGAFVKSLGVSGGLEAIVVGLAGVVFSTVAAFLNGLPATSALKRTLVIGSTVPGTNVAIVPKLRTRRGFKRDFNAVLHTGPKIGVTIPANAELKLSLGEHLAIF
jgi:hypothetical protein